MAFPIAAAPIIGAAVDAVSSAGSGLFNINQARKNRAFQERMYQRQLEDNRQNWRMMNEYNLPSAQVQRLRDANLNSLLMYSNGASGVTVANPANAASAPSGAQANADFKTNFGQALAESLKIREEVNLLREQARNLRNDSALKDAQTLHEMEKIYNTQENTRKTYTETQFNIQSFADRLNYQRLQNKREESVAALNDALIQTESKKRDEITSNISRNDAIIDDVYNQMKNRDKITSAQVKQINQDISNSIKVTAHNCALMDANARKATADAISVEIDNLIKEVNFPQYEKLYLGRLKADIYKAVTEGNSKAVEQYMNELIIRRQPNPGSSGESWMRWYNTYGEPILKAASGVGVIGVLSKIL